MKVYWARVDGMHTTIGVDADVPSDFEAVTDAEQKVHVHLERDIEAICEPAFILTPGSKPDKNLMLQTASTVV